MFKSALKTILVLFLFGFLHNIQGQCIADFNVNSKYCDKDTVSFSFTGTADHFEWNFDNPASGIRNTDTTENPKHFFSTPGLYNVKLVVFGNSCTDTIIKEVRILEKPTITFDYLDNCKDFDAKFSSNINIDSADSIRKIYWLADNNLIDSGAKISHSFGSTGTVDIKSVILTEEGCSDTFIKQITIYSYPEIETDIDKSCINQDINFNLKSGFEPSVKYKWNFGDNSSSSQSAPIHQYTNKGKFAYSLILTYTDNSSCLALGDSIEISDKPNSDFKLLSDSFQCFDNNKICLEFLGREKNVQSRSVIWGDGNQSKNFSLLDTTICYSYTDTTGGVFSVTVEVVDSFGCSNSTSYDSLTEVKPKIHIDFSSTGLFGCFATTSSFTNNSNIDISDVSRFIWDFGDENFDSTNWNPTHIYTKNGLFDVNLEVFDKLGCKGSYLIPRYIRNTNFDFNTYLDSAVSYCRSDNKFFYKQAEITGASVLWDWDDGDTTRDWNAVKSYANPGVYIPKVLVSLLGCTKDTIFDTITIVGPRALADNIINRYQCNIKDTLYFTNTSIYEFNKSRKTFWDFGDPYAPACTTNLALGQNVGMNCRYSTDSIYTKHFYTPGTEQCYFTKLVVSDTIVGCADSINIGLPLIPPKADIDLGISPPRKGMSIDGYKTCLSEDDDVINLLRLNLNQTQPACGRARWWVMWDSLAAVQSGNFNSHWEEFADSHYYTFNSRPADPSGKVTIGLIIENGTDLSNNVCRDTAWYHNFLQLEMYDPEFITDYDEDVQYCKGTEFTFRLKDTLQTAIKEIYWEWGDTKFDHITTNVTKPIKHKFKNAGVYIVKATVITNSGCVATYEKFVKVGYALNFDIWNIVSRTYCTGEEFNFTSIISYWGGTNEWNNVDRYNAGKELAFWDMGDGLGFQDFGLPIYTYKYEKSGIYTITLVAKDSAGCYDTSSSQGIIKIRNIETEILTDQDTFVCAQGIQFKADVYQSDSTSSVPQDPYTPATFKWDFGAGIQASTVKEPLIQMKEGNYKVRLIATDDANCSDTAFKDIVIIGPKADFDFVSDSIGCEPTYIELKNNSSGATNFIWKFNDENGNVVNTSSLSNVDFTYLKYGEYFPTLTAQGTFTRNGVNVNCANTFPDENNTTIRKVTSWETPNADFSHSTNCFSRTTQFTNKTTINTANISSVKWDFGDGNSSTDENPTHQYADTGWFTVSLIAFSDNGCSDTLIRKIMISPTPIPDFDFTEECAGVPINFSDSTKSFNDVIVKWKWDFGDSTDSELDVLNKTYNKGGAYNVKLIVTNMAGCSDSVSKIVNVHYSPEIDFNLNQFCSRQDVMISNLSSVQDTNLLFYNWDFDDATYSSDFEPDKSFANSGNYNVLLKATSGFGCTDSVTKNISIIPSPKASFTVNSIAQCFAEQNFIFTNNSTISSGSFSSFWDFGDGNNSGVESPSHIYANTGTYKVSLLTTATNGCTDTAFENINVQANPSANIWTNNIQQCFLGNKFTFSDITSGNQSRSWLIDGHIYSDSSFNYSFSDTGIHTVRLVVKSSSTCTDTTYRSVEVLPMPIAKIGVNIPNQCVNNQNYSFTDLTTLDKYPNWTSFWDFDNSKTSMQKNPSTTYSTAGFYDVSLFVTSSLGCSDTTTYRIEVYPKPKVDFTINDDEQCQINNFFEFTNKSSVDKGSLTYKWNFGDGFGSTTTNPNHRYVVSGKANVKLIAESSFGCVDSTSKFVTLRAKPTAIISVNAQQQCINPNLFVLTSKSKSNEGNFVSYEWNIPSQSIKSLQAKDSFSYSFNNHGTFTTNLFVTTNYGCADTVSMPLKVYPKPQASFFLSDTAQCINKQSFNFANSTTIPYGTLSYKWLFGDGNSSSISNPNHSYFKVDTFEVELTAISGMGCRDTAYQTVITHPKPDVDFSINDDGQCLVGNLYELKNLSSIKYGTLSYLWDFGNGKKSTEKDTQISYSVYGTYKILLKAESDEGCIDTLSHYVRVYPKPEPAFSINQEKQCLNENFYKFKSQSTVSGGSVFNKWLLDNESEIDGDSLFFTFDKIGLHNVKLYSISNFGCIDSTENDIRIWANPESSFSANNPAQCINTQNFQFINQSSIAEGNIASQLWNFGNDSTSSDSEPHQFFSNSGRYRISLISYSDSGCLDSFVNFIDVYPKPTAIFDINDTAQCLYTNFFEFYDKSIDTLNIINRFWVIGKDSSANSINTSYKFKDTGYHQIELQVISELGCADSTTREIYVKPMPDPSFEKLDVYYCRDTGPFSFTPKTSGGTFYGKNIENNLYYPDILWRDTVEYKVSVNGCLDSSSQITQIYPMPRVFLGSDTLLCKHEILQLDVSFWNSNYEWQDRVREAKYMIKRPGLYSVTVSNLCGTAKDSIYVEYSENNCRLYLPTAFSPNNDGLNDYYNPIVYDIEKFHIRILNRWGQIVYDGTQDDKGWDGTFKGIDCEAGIYIVQVSYSYPFNNDYIILYENTSINLIR